MFTFRPADVNAWDEAQIVMQSLGSGERVVLIEGGRDARYVETGHLVYALNGVLFAVAVDLDAHQVLGGPVPLVDGVRQTGVTGAAHFSIAGNGTLVYAPGDDARAQARTLVWVNREGREDPLRAPPAPYESPRVSPDGRSIVVEVRNPEHSDVTVYDLHRDTPTRLTFDPGADRVPIWSQDGQSVLFVSDRDGPIRLDAKAADGTGQDDRVTTSGVPQWPGPWSADGQMMIVTDIGRWDLQTISLGAEDRADGLIESEFLEFSPDVSPDGRWLAYVSNESGQFEVYVRPFPNVEDGLWQISRDSGASPLWAPTGQDHYQGDESGRCGDRAHL